MSFVQAYKRTKTYVHQFPDVKLVFEPNEKGDVVCDVADQSAVDRLLQTPTGFRLYGEQPEPAMSAILTDKVATLPPDAPSEVATLPPADHPHVMKDEAGAVVLDLRSLSDDELHAFAVANAIKVHPKAKGDTIRDKIVAFLTTEA